MNPPGQSLSCQSLSCFPFYKVTGYVTNSHWMGSHTNTRLPQQFIKLPWQSADTHIYSWVGGGNVEVKCIAQEHNDPARSRTQTSQPRPQRTNHWATTSPIAVRVRIVLKMIVVGRNDWCFNNQAVSYYGLWLSKCQSPPKTTDLYKATSTRT